MTMLSTNVPADSSPTATPPACPFAAMSKGMSPDEFRQAYPDLAHLAESYHGTSDLNAPSANVADVAAAVVDSGSAVHETDATTVDALTEPLSTSTVDVDDEGHGESDHCSDHEHDHDDHRSTVSSLLPETPPPKKARLPSPVRQQLKEQELQRRASLQNLKRASTHAAAGPPSPSGGVHFGKSTVIPDTKATDAKTRASASGMKHVERTRLYTDLNYRFAYLSEFIDFTDEDKAVIVSSAPLLADHVPAVVQAVYAKLLSFDIVAESFLHRMTNYDGAVIRDLSQLTTNSEQIKFRQAMLKKYLTCLMVGVNDGTTLLQYMDWVALIHTKNNSKHSSINVEYIHLNAMLSFLNSAMIDCIYALNLPRDRERKTLKAFSKLFFIQNDLMALYYTSDGLDIAGHMANRHQVVKAEAAKDPKVAQKKALELVGSGTLAVCAGVLLGWLLARK